MKLTCTSAYRTQSVVYTVGQIIEVKDEEGELLLRDSPGSFEIEQVKAISTETATGVKAPDRRLRGGNKRG